MSTYICQFLYIYLNISSNGVNFSTSTHRLSRSIRPENKMQLFGNDVIFPHRMSQCPIIVNNR